MLLGKLCHLGRLQKFPCLVTSPSLIPKHYSHVTKVLSSSCLVPYSNSRTTKPVLLPPRVPAPSWRTIVLNNHNKTNLLQTKNTLTPTNQRTLKIAESLVGSTPQGVQPYLQLMRMDKPIGTWLLFWPCGWSLALAAQPGCLPDTALLAIFGAGAFVMRGAGCTINDMWDRNIDRLVERTKDRPITSGQISMFDSLVFLGGQLGLGLLILLQLNLHTVLLGASVMGLVVLYPLMKRFTHYPQFVLGLAFNWGAVMGWSAVHDACNWPVCFSLYLAGISWTMIYDTIYAHQDKYDDVIIGMRSTAIKFGSQTPVCLGCFATMMVSSLAYTGYLCHLAAPYYASVAAIAAHLSHQIYTLDIDNREDCASKFRSNRHIGLLLFLGIVAGTYMKEEDVECETVIMEDVGKLLIPKLAAEE